MLGGGHLFHVFAFRSEHHESNAENGIGTGGEDKHFLIAAHKWKLHFGTFAEANPVALSFLDGVGPFQVVEVAEQTTGVSRHAQAPLAHHFLHHRIAATERNAFAHLIVSKHSAQLRAPVHHRVATVGDAVVHQRFFFFHLAHGIPLIGGEIVVAVGGSVAALATVLFKISHQFLNRASLIEGSVVVTLKHFNKCPLRPLVVFRIASAHFTVPVVAETNLFELFAIARNILHGGHFRVLTSLDSVLLCWQSIRVVTHRMEHVETVQSFIARKNVAGNVTQWVTYVQTCSRWIREHVEHIVFGLAGVYFTLVDVLVAPVLLPFLFNFAKIIFHSFFM